MRRIVRAVSRLLRLLAPVLALALGHVAVAAPPPPTHWATDTAGFLSATTRHTLDTRLAAFERASGHQVLVWIGRTTGGAPLEEWAADAFHAWRVGRRGLDDGLVLFILSEDHSARIEVGYGLEGQMTDAMASRILAEEIIPRIRAGDRDGAVGAGVERILDVVGGAGAPPETAPMHPLQGVLLGLFVIAALVLLIRYPRLAVYLFSILSSSGKGNGGGWGGFRGGGGRSGGGGASGKW